MFSFYSCTSEYTYTHGLYGKKGGGDYSPEFNDQGPLFSFDGFLKARGVCLNQNCLNCLRILDKLGRIFAICTREVTFVASFFPAYTSRPF